MSLYYQSQTLKWMSISAHLEEDVALKSKSVKYGNKDVAVVDCT
jgi:hypothetical protein